jgi:hypothetical protein
MYKSPFGGLYPTTRSCTLPRMRGSWTRTCQAPKQTTVARGNRALEPCVEPVSPALVVKHAGLFFYVTLQGLSFMSAFA